MDSGKNATVWLVLHALTHAIPKTEIADREFTMHSRLSAAAVVVAVVCTGGSSHAREKMFRRRLHSPVRATIRLPIPPIVGGEIYLVDHLADGSFSIPRRVTENCAARDHARGICGELLCRRTFPALSPDGRGKIVFDSNRLRAAGEPINTSDLFLMNHDGSEQVYLTRGGCTDLVSRRSEG